MILLDTETTGLIQNGVIPLSQQPYIFEFAAIALDDLTLEEHDGLHFVCKPPIPLPEKSKQISGVTDDHVKDAKPFSAFFKQLVSFFLGEETMVAHNCAFDSGMLRLELERLGKQYQFPWPPRQLCTLELTRHIRHKFLKQTELYEIMLGTAPAQTHRALDDVRQLADIVRALRAKEIL